ncbi:hypothetical protein V8B97DRAFT_1988199, partial [Scleroderma yunnanense]
MEPQQLVISTQQVNFNLNIEYAIKFIMTQVDRPFDRKYLEAGILEWMPYLKDVSDLIAGAAGCLLTVFTPTLVLFDLMAGPAGCVLTVLIPTLLVSDLMPGLAECHLTVFTPTLVMLPGQE